MSANFVIAAELHKRERISGIYKMYFVSGDVYEFIPEKASDSIVSLSPSGDIMFAGPIEGKNRFHGFEIGKAANFEVHHDAREESEGRIEIKHSISEPIIHRLNFKILSGGEVIVLSDIRLNVFYVLTSIPHSDSKSEWPLKRNYSNSNTETLKNGEHVDDFIRLLRN